MEESFLQPIQGYIVHPNIDTIIWDFYDKLTRIYVDKTCIQIRENLYPECSYYKFLYKLNQKIIYRVYIIGLNGNTRISQEERPYYSKKGFNKIKRIYMVPPSGDNERLLRCYKEEPETELLKAPIAWIFNTLGYTDTAKACVMRGD